MDAASALLETLGQRARDLRQARGLTLRALPRRRASARFLMDVESGRANISVRRLAHLADACGRRRRARCNAGPPAADSLDRAPACAAPAKPRSANVSRAACMPFVELDRRIEERAGLALSNILAAWPYYRSSRTCSPGCSPRPRRW
jgi:transcriptional regulator with XRE-family HTH domain